MKTKKVIFYLLFLFLIFILCTYFIYNFSNPPAAVLGDYEKKLPTVVIDAGHGGVDGGAVGKDGLLEKDINLLISLKLRDMLKLSGFNVVMIRESDISIHDEGSDSIRSKKVSDIKNRLKIYNSNPDCIVISIHQNKFEQSKYSGAQLFYSPNNPNSKTLADLLKGYVVSLTQPDNKREVKKAASSIYLLSHATTAAVIIECGFLSNEKEAGLLATDDYRQQLAFAIYLGVLDYST